VARRIDADPYDPEVPQLELFITPGKADQLPIAVRSPVPPIEHENQRRLLEFLVQPERLPFLVRQLEVLHLLALARVSASLCHVIPAGGFLF
jgi:hypothetical protein